jgi:hypothetical protein
VAIARSGANVRSEPPQSGRLSPPSSQLDTVGTSVSFPNDERRKKAFASVIASETAAREYGCGPYEMRTARTRSLPIAAAVASGAAKAADARIAPRTPTTRAALRTGRVSHHAPARASDF